MRLFSSVYIVVVCCILWSTVPAHCANGSEGKKVEVVAHRGFSAIAPENTLASVRKAIECGADGCEFDVMLTADGVMILSHDVTLKRAANIDKKVVEMTLAEIQQYDVSQVKPEFVESKQFQGEKMPTLDETLALLNESPCKPIIEIKTDGCEEMVVELIKKYDMEQRCALIDFSAKRTKRYKELNPNLTVAWICSFDKKKVSENEVIQTVIDTLRECKTDLVDINFNNITPEFLKAMKKENIRVWCWTVNKEEDMKRLLSYGEIESITSDHPDRVLNILKMQSK